eukprot:c13350_g1_i2.p1 GENE.c13350_g1_i2~~c13350_g1_i2.p1  ORF type:complete len:544 (+),score=114.93 c13350_g1_i2:245-1633(+)
MSLADLGVSLVQGRKPLHCSMNGPTDDEVDFTHRQQAAAEAEADAKRKESSENPAPNHPVDNPSDDDMSVSSEDGFLNSQVLHHLMQQHQQQPRVRFPMMPSVAGGGGFDDFGDYSGAFFRDSRLAGPDQASMMNVLEQLDNEPMGELQQMLTDLGVEQHSGTFREAVAAARHSFKYLVVVLHNTSSESSQTFLLQAFTSPVVLETLSRRCLLWHRSSPPTDPDKAAHWLQDASSTLFLNQLPFVGILLCIGSQMTVVDVLQGEIGIDDLVVHLINSIDSHSSSLDEAMARAHDDSNVTNVLAGQDADYQEALRQDQERQAQELKAQKELEEAQATEQRRKEEAEREAQRERERRESDEQRAREAQQRLMFEKAAALPEIPPISDDSACDIQLRTSDGRLRRRFPQTALVQSIVDFAISEGIDMSGARLVQAFPRSVLDPTQSLKQANLHPTANLFIETTPK